MGRTGSAGDGTVSVPAGRDGEQLLAVDDRAVRADRQVDLDGVTGVIGQTLDQEADPGDGRAGLWLGNGDREIGAGRVLSVPGDGLLGGTLNGEVIE